MNKTLTFALIIALSPLSFAHADMNAMASKSKICAKLIQVEAMKKSSFNKCVQAEKDQEFKRKSCNKRPDQAFCNVIFKNHSETKVTF